MRDVRRWLPLFLAALALMRPHAAAATPARAPARGVHDFRVRTARGGEQSLADYGGHVLLIVNTASRCGFTPQYRSLETLYRRYHARGLEVLAFPANDFLGQEPGSDAEIQSFCSTNYGVTFPVFAKLHVRGRDIAPLYAWLTRESGFPGAIGWNFAKFVVGRDGRVLARFGSGTDPLEPRLTAAIEHALAAR